MAGGSIKGITIEFRGDTTKLDKALRQINTETRNLDKELKLVDKALKFKPGSVDLWRQKQTILNQKIAETREKLTLLKNEQARMDAAGVDKTSEEYRKVQREIIECESKLKTFNRQLKETGNAKLTALGEELQKIGKKMEDVGKTLTQKVTAPITALFGVSAKSALSFGDAIAKVSTISDESQVPISSLKSSIMDLSNQSGIGANELAEATYQALSASIETKDAARFVGDAAGLAKAGFLDTASAVDVLTTIINAYGYEAEDAEKISSQLIQTQNDGKTTVNELAAAMGQVIPTASALNIPLEQLNASYVLLTKQGINTANATTYLNGMFTELGDGGSAVSKILQDKTGKTFGQLMNEGWTLGDVMQLLSDSVDGDSEAFLNLWGNTRAGKGALALLNGGVNEFNEEAEKMSKSSGNVGKALKKLKTPGAAARKALNSIVNAGIQIGDVLAPYVEKAAKFIEKLSKKFQDLSPGTKKAVVAVLAVVAAIGPLLVLIGKLAIGVGAIIKLVGVVGPAITALGSSALLPIVGIVAAVVAAGVLLYKNWDKIKAVAIQVKTAVVNTWNSLKTSVTSIFNSIKTTISNVWTSIKNASATLWENIKTTISGKVTAIKKAVDFSGLVSKVKQSVSGVKDALSAPFIKAKELVQSAVKKIKSIFPIKLGKIFSGVKLPHFKISGGKIPWGIGGAGVKPTVSISWYKEGGIMTKPTVFHAGGEAGDEAILPLTPFWKKMDELIEAQQGGGITVNVYGTPNMNVDELAEAVERRLVMLQRRRNMAYGGI